MQTLNPSDTVQKSPQKSPIDSYSHPCRAGKTIGTRSPSGEIRQGADVEKRIAIDNGALRLQPLLQHGWGRQGIAYGPYQRTNGLAFAVFMLNGHNTSQTEWIEPLRRRLHQWLVGGQHEDPIDRLWRWWRSPQKRGMVRRLLGWAKISAPLSKYFRRSPLDENLAVGWFSSSVPANPLSEGNAFIVHATGAENGELWTRVGDRQLCAFRGLQNLQTYYIVVLRERGAAYYAASVSNALGLQPYPDMRPIAIDPFNEDATVYAALYQSILGQDGFRIDTRVYGAQVAQIPDLGSWYGTAQVADALTGEGPLNAAEVGGHWRVTQGQFQQTPKGAIATVADSLALLEGDSPAGLIHATVETEAKVTGVGLRWRVQDGGNGWSFLADGDKCQLRRQQNGTWQTVARSELWSLKPNATHSLQILDRGDSFGLYLNGKLLFAKWFEDPQGRNATGVGISATDANPSQYLRHFEVHPRSVPIPTQLDLGSPWVVQGKQVVVAEDFAGSPQDLAGKTTSVGSKVWQKPIGTGVIELTGNGTAKVKADRQHPNPDRTAYTVPWDHPHLADVQVEILPPGTGMFQREKGRGGLIFWQDADNYLIVNNWLDDAYNGSSISSFFHLNGFEELYDAVWTNIARRVSWGVPHQLRIVFDGMHYTVFINGEPVLYRALTDVYPDAKRLSITRVGILVNWEWGHDTGSTFKNFVAKA